LDREGDGTKEAAGFRTGKATTREEARKSSALPVVRKRASGITHRQHLRTKAKRTIIEQNRRAQVLI
jgi:hypothetical protein